jgi:hypothetical protein
MCENGGPKFWNKPKSKSRYSGYIEKKEISLISVD